MSSRQSNTGTIFFIPPVYCKVAGKRKYWVIITMGHVLHHKNLLWSSFCCNFTAFEEKKQSIRTMIMMTIVMKILIARLTKCAKSACIWSYSGLHFLAFVSPYLSVFSPTDKNNSQYGHFSGIYTSLSKKTERSFQFLKSFLHYIKTQFTFTASDSE